MSLNKCLWKAGTQGTLCCTYPCWCGMSAWPAGPRQQRSWPPSALHRGWRAPARWGAARSHCPALAPCASRPPRSRRPPAAQGRDCQHGTLRNKDCSNPTLCPKEKLLPLCLVSNCFYHPSAALHPLSQHSLEKLIFPLHAHTHSWFWLGGVFFHFHLWLKLQIIFKPSVSLQLCATKGLDPTP